ncbi:MAG: hypothetical protein WCR31_12665 [Treponema sp.]
MNENKIIIVSAVLIFVVFAFVFSYARYGKKAFDNTSASTDGKTYVCRRYVEIDRVIAVNAKKKYQKKEIKDWSYDDKTGEIRIDKNNHCCPINLPDFQKAMVLKVAA